MLQLMLTGTWRELGVLMRLDLLEDSGTLQSSAKGVKVGSCGSVYVDFLPKGAMHRLLGLIPFPPHLRPSSILSLCSGASHALRVITLCSIYDWFHVTYSMSSVERGNMVLVGQFGVHCLPNSLSKLRTLIRHRYCRSKLTLNETFTCFLSHLSLFLSFKLLISLAVTLYV
jgi:hypothetical protein